MGYYPPDSNEEWLALQCPVPVKECPKKDVITHWWHASCGGRMKIGTHMKIVCTSCNHGSLWSSWQFKCANHDFKPVGNNVDMYNALSRYINIHYIDSEKSHVIQTILRNLLYCKCVFYFSYLLSFRLSPNYAIFSYIRKPENFVFLITCFF